jgi:hypothetical protein
LSPRPGGSERRLGGVGLLTRRRERLALLLGLGHADGHRLIGDEVECAALRQVLPRLVDPSRRLQALERLLRLSLLG